MAEMTLEEAFAAATVDVPAGMVDDVFVIDAPNRKIIVPDSESVFGVETDMDVERKYFRCPRIVGDNIDLYAHKIYVVYVTAKDVNGTFLPEIVNDKYWCDDVAVDGDCITFSWVLSDNVLSKSGIIAFKILAATTENGLEKTRWNTAPAYGTILMTVPDGDDIAERYPDIVTQLLERMNAVEAIATEEAMQGYVNEYLGQHPLQLDETLTDNTKAAPAGMVGELKSDLSDYKNKTTNLSANIFPLENVKDHMIYTDNNVTVVEKSNDDYYCFVLDVKNGDVLTFTGTSFSMVLTDENGNLLKYYNGGALTLRNYTVTIDMETASKLYVSNRYDGFPKDSYMVVNGDTLPTEYIPLGYIFNEKYIKDLCNELQEETTKSTVYYVGANREHTSFLGLMNELKNDETEKTVYVDSGVYDLFEEIGGAEFCATIPSDANWKDVSIFIPKNTKIIGLGHVVFNFNPTSAEVGNGVYLLSPINTKGNSYIENIEIRASNCRYCIHDDNSNDDYFSTDYTIKRAIYKNVRAYKSGGGDEQAYGGGCYNEMYFDFENCIFKSNGIPWSIHSNGGFITNENISPSINFNGCAFINSNDGYSMRFGNVDWRDRNINVNISNCYMSGNIEVCPEMSGITKNQFDLILIGCSNVNIDITSTNNPFTPTVYNIN